MFRGLHGPRLHSKLPRSSLTLEFTSDGGCVLLVLPANEVVEAKSLRTPVSGTTGWLATSWIEIASESEGMTSNASDWPAALESVACGVSEVPLIPGAM